MLEAEGQEFDVFVVKGIVGTVFAFYSFAPICQYVSNQTDGNTEDSNCVGRNFEEVFSGEVHGSCIEGLK